MFSSTIRQRISQPYMWAVISLGAAACVFTVTRLQPVTLGLRFILISLVTLAFGSRVSVKIPRVRGQISISDTFIFFALLFFGGEAAILLAAADALCTSLRITKKKMVMSFNAGVYVCSTFLTVWVLRFVFGGELKLLPIGDSSAYISAVCVMALVQYVTNSGMVAAGVALRSGLPVWQMWRQNFLWTSITYFAGASSAGIIVKLVGRVRHLRLPRHRAHRHRRLLHLLHLPQERRGLDEAGRAGPPARRGSSAAHAGAARVGGALPLGLRQRDHRHGRRRARRPLASGQPLPVRHRRLRRGRAARVGGQGGDAPRRPRHARRADAEVHGRQHLVAPGRVALLPQVGQGGLGAPRHVARARRRGAARST